MKFVKWLRRLVSIVLILIFSIITTLTIISHAVFDNLTSVSRYEQLIKETRLAERGRGLLANGLVMYGLSTQLTSSRYISGHSLRTWETVADVLVPKDWLEENLLLVVRSFIEWLNDPSIQNPQIEIALSPVIATLRSSQGSLAVIHLLEGTPQCSPDVKEIIILEEELMSCIPEGGNITKYGERIAQYLSNNLIPVVSFPILLQIGAISDAFIQYMVTIRNVFQALNIALGLGYRLSLFFYLLYSLLWSSSPRRLLSKLPTPLYCAGGLSLLLLGILQLFMMYGTNFALQLLLPFARVEYQILFQDVLSFLSKGIKWQWFVWSIYLIIAVLVIHISILVSNRIIKRRKPKTETEPQKRQRIRKQYR